MLDLKGLTCRVDVGRVEDVGELDGVTRTGGDRAGGGSQEVKESADECSHCGGTPQMSAFSCVDELTG